MSPMVLHPREEIVNHLVDDNIFNLLEKDEYEVLTRALNRNYSKQKYKPTRKNVQVKQTLGFGYVFNLDYN